MPPSSCAEDVTMINKLAELREYILDDDRHRGALPFVPLVYRAVAVLHVSNGQRVRDRNRQRHVIFHDVRPHRWILERKSLLGLRFARNEIGSGGYGSCDFR